MRGRYCQGSDNIPFLPSHPSHLGRKEQHLVPLWVGISWHHSGAVLRTLKDTINNQKSTPLLPATPSAGQSLPSPISVSWVIFPPSKQEFALQAALQSLSSNGVWFCLMHRQLHHQLHSHHGIIRTGVDLGRLREVTGMRHPYVRGPAWHFSVSESHRRFAPHKIIGRRARKSNPALSISAHQTVLMAGRICRHSRGSSSMTVNTQSQGVTGPVDQS